MAITAKEIAAIEWERAPDRVEPGEPFDLVVQVFGTSGGETEGSPITFYIDDDPFFTTTGADIPSGDFAFDGRVAAEIAEEGVYRLHAEVAGLRTNDHLIGVGMEPNADAVGSPGEAVSELISSPAGVVVGAVGAEVLRRILTE